MNIIALGRNFRQKTQSLAGLNEIPKGLANDSPIGQEIRGARKKKRMLGVIPSYGGEPWAGY
jgi:hypothetical protein